MTSQIFANIYLHEFDRFVRHTVKPQAYVRYGDDFLLFGPTRRQVHIHRQQAADFLETNLQQVVHPHNNVVISASAGLKFLGHDITADHATVDKHTTESVLAKINRRNIASYRSLPLLPETKKRLDWILLEKYVDIL